MKTRLVLILFAILIAWPSLSTMAGSREELKTLQADLDQSLNSQKELLNRVSRLNEELKKSNNEKETINTTIKALNQQLLDLDQKVKTDNEKISIRLHDIENEEKETGYKLAVEKASQILQDSPVGGKQGTGSYDCPTYDSILQNSKDPNYRPRRIGILLESWWFRDFMMDPPDNWAPEHWGGREGAHITATDGYYKMESGRIIIDIPEGYHLAKIDFEYQSWIDMMYFTFEGPGKTPIRQSFGRRNSGKNKESIGRSGYEILGVFGLKGQFLVNMGARLRTTAWPPKPE